MTAPGAAGGPYPAATGSPMVVTIVSPYGNGNGNNGNGGAPVQQGGPLATPANQPSLNDQAYSFQARAELEHIGHDADDEDHHPPQT